jgi:Mlc titration factor MtfA (ptsG expression regulator)
MLLLTSARRKRLRSQPVPPDWVRILTRTFPLYPLLPPVDQQELHGHLQVFLAEKEFEGVNGLVLTDEMRVTVAANACLLLLHRESDYYPGLSTVVLYPGEYVGRRVEVDETGIVREEDEVRSGESWVGGSLVLSWEDVRLGGQEGCEDYNVVIHEFAHQWDLLDGITEPVPLFGRKSARRLWAEYLQEDFAWLCAEVDGGNEETLLDPYAVESPAEFFAVTTEAFFQLPLALQQWHPRVYDGLCRYFRQDPASWEWSCPVA